MLIVWREDTIGEWIMVGKYTYLEQDTSLPTSMVKKVRKLAYHFIWDGRKGSNASP